MLAINAHIRAPTYSKKYHFLFIYTHPLLHYNKDFDDIKTKVDIKIIFYDLYIIKIFLIITFLISL